MVKRFLSIILVMCIMISVLDLFPTIVFATTSEKCGNDLTWSFNSGVLTISGTGKMNDWTSLNPAPWEPIMSSIISVVIEDGVTSIGRDSFLFGENIVDVKIGNSVTSIGGSAFCFCKKLENIKIPESVTEISEYAFECCYELKTISISKHLTKINWSVFSNCPKLTHIEVDENNENYCDV